MEGLDFEKRRENMGSKRKEGGGGCPGGTKELKVKGVHIFNLVSRGRKSQAGWRAEHREQT